MVYYLGDEHLDPIFAFVAERYGHQEEVPIYRNNIDGVSSLLGVLERTRMDAYYPNLLDKATHLLVEINKGHFFSNGNKRLALVITTTFLTLNNKHLKELSKDEYQKALSSLFPKHKEYTDFPEFAATDYATYNLSIIITNSGSYNLEHETLKMNVRKFLSKAIEAQ